MENTICFEDIEYVFSYLNHALTDENREEVLDFFSEERSCVREQFKNLSWLASKQEQKGAINFLADNLKPCEYIFLILAGEYALCYVNHEKRYIKCCTDKSRWENAANVIVKIGWPKIENIMIPLFYWLLDPNWPGGETIRNLLLSLPKNAVEEAYNGILAAPHKYHAPDYADLVEAVKELLEDFP